MFWPRWLIKLRDEARRLVTAPLEELNRAQRAGRHVTDIVRHGGHDFMEDRATEMAAALTYRTLFSLVPVLILTVFVLGTFLPKEEALRLLQEQTEGLLQMQSGGATTQPDKRSELVQMLNLRLKALVEMAYNVKGGSIGAAGALVLLWGAFGLLVTIEDTFNRVYRSPKGRPWRQRLPIYWTALTLGPVLLVVSLYAAGEVMATARATSGIGPLVEPLSRFAALFASWLLLFVLYMLMPHTRVRVIPAAVGAFVAAVLWELGKGAFKLYVARVVPASMIYGTLGLAPLFLLWLYGTWLAVIFGLELTHTLQTLRGRRRAERAALSRRDDPAGEELIRLVAEVTRRHTRGQTTHTMDAAEQLGMRPERAELGLARLVENGLMRVVSQSDGEAYVPALPPARISARSVLAAAAPVPGAAPAPAPEILQRLHEAQLKAAGEVAFGEEGAAHEKK